jgi:glycosyltransferase involved in cell wall biosynthesis
MKILHVIPYIAPRYGGPSQTIVTMCSALATRNIDVLIATTNADGRDRLTVPIEREVTYRGLPVIFFRRHGHEAFRYSGRFARWIDQHVREFNLVHIHDVFQHAPITAAAACRKYKIPYIVRPLGTLDPWSLQQKRFRKKLFWHLFVRKMLIGASAIHYTTEEEKRLVESTLGLEKGVVIPNGLDLSILDNEGGRQEEFVVHKPYILALSRLHYKKGFDLLIPAFARLVRRGAAEHWRLLLAGDGDPDYVDHLKSIAAKEGVAERVIFTGWLDQRAKKQALRQASLMALPSYQENFGNCLVESLAYGVPVVVSPRVNLAPDIVSENVGWIAPLDIDGLCNVLCEATAQERERQLRGERGAAYSRRYLPASIAMRLEELYYSLDREGCTRRVSGAL